MHGSAAVAVCSGGASGRLCVQRALALPPFARCALHAAAPAPPCTVEPHCRDRSSGCCLRRHATACQASNVDFDLLEIELPEVDNDVESYQGQMGGKFDDFGTPVSFGNKEEALQALETSAVLSDFTHWDRLHISGRDRLKFLHGQSTFDCVHAKEGDTFDTVFVTAQGRCINLAKCLVLGNGLLLLVDPGSGDGLAARLNKFILYGDEVSITDVSLSTRAFTLAGPYSTAVLEGLEATVPGPGQVAVMGFQGCPVVVAEGSGLASPGFTLVVDEQAAAELWRALTTKGATPMGEWEWGTARIQQGRPTTGSELTEQHTPLEAGLYHAVSLNKGCYMGQETLAKVHKLNAVKQQLQGLLFEGPVTRGTPLLSGTDKAGTVTSVAELADGSHIGLGYLRCRANGVQIPLEGLQLTAAGVPTRVVSRPYSSWHFPEGQGAQEPAPNAAGDLKDRAVAAKASKEAEKAADAAAKEERLKAMQERLAAWQAEQAAQ